MNSGEYQYASFINCFTCEGRIHTKHLMANSDFDSPKFHQNSVNHLFEQGSVFWNPLFSECLLI